MKKTCLLQYVVQSVVLCVAALFAVPVCAQPNLLEQRLTLSVMQRIAIAEMQGKLSWVRLESESELESVLQHVEITPEQIEAMKLTNQEMEKLVNSELEPLNQKLDTPNNISEDDIAIVESIVTEVFDKAFNHINAAYSEILTPEQIQKMREYELVAPSIFESEEFGISFYEPMPNFDAYKALELSDEQLKQLNAMQEEAVAEHKQFVAALQNEMHDICDYDEAEKHSQKREKLKRFREKVREILTPEQLAKLEKLETEISAKLKKKPEKVVDSPEPPAWRPDENSWKPGDPIPEGMEPKMKRHGFPGLF